MAKREISIDVFEITFTKRTKNENKILNTIFDNELNRKDNNSSEPSDVFKISDFKYDNKEKYYTGILIYNKGYNLPVASNSSSETIRDLPIDKDESLGYMTTFLYDVDTQIIFIERTMNGVTIERLFQFFYHHHKIEGKLKANNVLDPKIIINFEKLAKIRKFRIEVARVTNGKIFSSKDENVKHIIDASKDTGADKIVVELSSYGKSNYLSLRKIKQLVNILKGYNSDTNEVPKLELIGKDEDDNYMKPIDMVNEIMKRSISIEVQRNNNITSAIKRIKLLEILFNEEKDGLQSAYGNRYENE